MAADWYRAGLESILGCGLTGRLSVSTLAFRAVGQVTAGWDLARSASAQGRVDRPAAGAFMNLCLRSDDASEGSTAPARRLFDDSIKLLGFAKRGHQR